MYEYIRMHLRRTDKIGWHKNYENLKRKADKSMLHKAHLKSGSDLLICTADGKLF